MNRVFITVILITTPALFFAQNTSMGALKVYTVTAKAANEYYKQIVPGTDVDVFPETTVLVGVKDLGTKTSEENTDLPYLEIATKVECENAIRAWIEEHYSVVDTFLVNEPNKVIVKLTDGKMISIDYNIFAERTKLTSDGKNHELIFCYGYNQHYFQMKLYDPIERRKNGVVVPSDTIYYPAK